MKTPKKMMIAIMLGISACSIAQTTSNSTDPAATKNKQSGATAPAGQNNGKQAGASTTDKQTSKSDVKSQKTNQANIPATPSNPSGSRNGATVSQSNASARPGGATNQNANDVGSRTEKENSKSMLNSKEAIAQRKKNLTESDTLVKKGSGSAPKNTKNLTGKTNNYQNQATKRPNRD